jgi:hypothetical protein
MLQESIFNETFEDFPFFMEKDELYTDDVVSCWTDVELTQRINDAVARAEFE